MDIGAIGWWSFDNQGDLAMLDALRQGLAPHHVVPIDIGFPAQEDTLYRLNRLDYVILGGGTLIRGIPVPPFDTYNAWQDRLECPMGVVGLGVETIGERYRPAIDALVERSGFFYVRDNTSGQLLGLQKVRVGPDLTFSQPLQPSVRRSATGTRPVCGVNLRYSPAFDPQPWLEVIARLPIDVRGIPVSSYRGFGEQSLLRRLDPMCARAYDSGLYSGLDLMVGTAFHAVLFAIQTAVPVIAIAYAPKVRRFMEDVGLAQYVLSVHEQDRLSDLVEDVLCNRRPLRQRLIEIRERLHQQAGDMMQNVRDAVQAGARRVQRTGPPVTAIVLGSGDRAQNRRTLVSCAGQTYRNIEILYATPDVSDNSANTLDDERVTVLVTDPSCGAGRRLAKALAVSSGKYVLWLEGGDWLTEDALDCLVSRLEAHPSWDVVYADSWVLGQDRIPVGICEVHETHKLYRRDVVGPCFMVRSDLLNGRGVRLVEESPLPAYLLWLQAYADHEYRPFHATLSYSGRQPRAPRRVANERSVRRMWRSDLPGWKRAMWRVIDSEFGERWLVRPAACLYRMWGRMSHVGR